MAYDMKGAVHVIGATTQVSSKFSKRSLVLSVMDGKYEQLVEFEATGDKCSELDSFVIGEDVRVTFNIRGREWRKPGGDTRYFVSLNIWKVERVGDERRPNGGGGSGQDLSDRGAPSDAPPPGDDDLPF